MRRVLGLLVGVAVAGYLGINLVLVPRGAPLFLVLENIVYAVAYAVLGYGAIRGSRLGLGLLSALAFFNAGRVSRTIIGPDGSLGPLAAQHAPLLVLLLGLGAVGLYGLLGLRARW